MATERVFNDQWGDWKRSCYCGEPRAAAVGKEMTLVGWVHSRRDHGGVIFVDLRDRSGICQIVFRPEVDPVGHEKAKQIRSEDVIAVRGTLSKRSRGNDQRRSRHRRSRAGLPRAALAQRLGRAAVHHRR